MSNKRLATETIMLRVTSEDKQLLQQGAEAEGYESVSTWLRHFGKKRAKQALLKMEKDACKV